MQLVTFTQLDEQGDSLEYKLDNNKKLYNLTNVSVDLEGIYKFRTPVRGTERDRFIIKYFGNNKITVDGVDQETAHYILTKEHENSQYLIAADSFEQLFVAV